MKSLKVVVIGGGSSYTPELIEGLIKCHNELPVGEVCLVDIEEGRGKLSIVGGLAARMLEKAGLEIKLHTTLDRIEALKGAYFVVTQFRVGGLDARARDERFPLKHDVIGQETTGPGGMAKALRTIPVILDICKDMEQYCPDAWLINFTNPAGMVTEAVLKHTNIRCIGLCNVPINMVKTTAKLLDAESKDIYIDFVGLNHLVWGRKVWHKGEDVTERALQAMLDGSSLNMKNIPDLKWSRSFIRALGMLPCPYHRYYYMKDMILKEEQEAAAEGGKGTRAELVKDVEKRLFELYKDVELTEKPKELESRGGAYYSEAAVSLINAIYNDKREIHTVNTRNNGTIKELPDNCVIETNCIVGNRGATPLNLGGSLPPEILGLIQKVKAYEILAIEASVKGDRDKALLALVNHPLVPSAGIAEKLLEDMLSINEAYLPQFKKDKGLRLIINADDFGLTRGCSEGIIKALKEGVATSTTIMINMEGSREAVELAKQNGIGRIGLHLNLTCGKPVLPAERVSSLVDKDGSFYRRSAMLLPKMDIKEAEAELWAQVDKFKATGMGLTHLDSHHHIHMYDGLTELVAEMAKKLGVPLRQTGEAVKLKIKEKGVKTTDHFTMKFYGEGASVENLCSILDKYEDGVMEIMTHPAILDEELQSVSSYNSDRVKELEVLTSDSLKKYIERRKIRLISFDALDS